jgi:hypothetical protein
MTMALLVAWLQARFSAVLTQAREEPERGEIVEKVIIVAAAAAIAIAAMAAISLAINIKLGSLEL